jgi:arylformamidase
MKLGRVVDLSHELHPGQEEYKLELKTAFTDELFPQYTRRPEDWYIISDLYFVTHVGTHIEMPYHRLREGQDTSTFPLQNLIGEAVILNFTGKGPGEVIDLVDLQKFDELIREGDIVILRTDLSKFYRTERSHDRPWMTKRAVGWLVEYKKIKCLGIDCSGIEGRGEEYKYQPNHLILFEHGVPLIENLSNLEELKEERVLLFVLPL